MSIAMNSIAIDVARRPEGARGIAGASGLRTAPHLVRLDRALGELERARALVDQAERLRTVDARAAFELAHRSALRAAGVVIDEANRARRRRLPLNAWDALSRCGVHHRAWAQEVAPMVAERARLDRDETASPDLALLEEHCRRTRERIEGVRAEITLALLPELPAAVERGRD